MPGDAPTPPEGFERHFRRSGLTDPWEPLFSRKLEDRIQIGLFSTNAHCNSRGLIHGGLIAALSDNAMGLTCAMASAKAGRDITKGLVTISLGLDYIGAGKFGQWLQIDPELTKAGGSICFVRASITSDAAIIATANATFKLL